MMRPLSVVLLIVLATLPLSCLASPTIPLPPQRVPDAVGVNIHFTDPRPGEMKMLAAGGFRWVRMDFTWSATEPEPGRYDFSAYDRLMAALAPHHIRAIFILDYSNPHYDDGLSPHTDSGRAAFARWAAAGVRHFRGRGVVWEMYNEPNIGFWTPDPKVDDYVKLALAVGKAIRAAAPGELYVGPATSGFAFPFIEACFKAGLLRYWDAVSLHPYRSKCPETAAEDYRTLRALIARYAPRGKRIPIISSEWGYTDGALGLSPELQGKYLARQWLTNLSNDVPISIWYDWHDDGTDPKDGEHHFGTVLNPYHAGRDPVYDPKPGYIAARTLTTQLRGFTFNKALVCGGPRDHVLLFTRGRDVRVVAWSETKEPHTITIPASPGTFRAVGWTGEAQPPIRADANGLRVAMTDAPVYLTPTKPNAVLGIAAGWQRVPLEVITNDRSVRIVARAGRHAARVTVATTCAIEPQPYDVALRAGGFVLRQRTYAVSAHPLGLSVQPTEKAGVRLVIDNPSGDPFDGRARVHVVERGYRGGMERALLLHSGQTEAAVPFALGGAHGEEWHVSGRILSSDGRPLVRLKEALIVPIQTAGAAPGDLTVTPDGQPAVPVEYALSTGPAPDPRDAPAPDAYRLQYKMGKGERFLRVELAPDLRKPLPAKPRWFGLWIYGDGNNNYPRMRYLDTTGQRFQVSGDRITWKGWRFERFSLDPTDATYSGSANDGAAHYPIRIEAPLVMWNGYGRAVEGAVWFACPSVMY